MGSFSIWHWLIVFIIMGNLAMIVHIAVSPRTQGAQKAIFVIAALLLPVVPYLVWLVARKSASEADSLSQVRDAEARARVAEAQAREAEARARIAKSS